jgi:hypothetical protein
MNVLIKILYPKYIYFLDTVSHVRSNEILRVRFSFVRCWFAAKEQIFDSGKFIIA